MAGIDLTALAPEEAVEAFRRKGYELTFDWRDMQRGEHSRAFTVAKVACLDLLTDIRRAVDAAISEGITLREFERRLTPLLQERGWWGRQAMTDPLTGETRDVQLGSPRRLRIIYDTNLRMAYAAGRWERIEQVAERRPWLRYVAVLDDRTRDQHRRWHDTVLRWDDPWWNQHAPPNGWNCRCTVQQLSDRDIARRGLAPSDPPSAPARSWVNRRTGEVREVPGGVDPGFDYNVGRSNMDHLRATTTAKLDAAAPDLARETIASLTRSPAFESFLRSPGAGRAGYPVATGGQRLGGSLETVTLPPETAQRLAGTLTAEDWRRAQAAIDAGAVTTSQVGATIEGAGYVLEVEARDGRVEVRDMRPARP